MRCYSRGCAVSESRQLVRELTGAKRGIYKTPLSRAGLLLTTRNTAYGQSVVESTQRIIPGLLFHQVSIV